MSKLEKSLRNQSIYQRIEAGEGFEAIAKDYEGLGELGHLTRQRVYAIWKKELNKVRKSIRLNNSKI